MSKIRKLLMCVPLVTACTVYGNGNCPDLLGTSLSAVIDEDVVTNVEENNGIQVKSDTPKPVFVAKSIADIKGQKGFSFSNMTKVRKSPWGATIGQLSNGEEFDILGNDKEWCYIKYNGGEGYVHSSWCDVKGYDYKIPLSGFLINNARFYDENGDIIGQFDDNDENNEIGILADYSYFWLIKHDSKEYFVRKTDVDDDFVTDSDNDEESDEINNIDKDQDTETADGNDEYSEFLKNLEQEIGSFETVEENNDDSETDFENTLELDDELEATSGVAALPVTDNDSETVTKEGNDSVVESTSTVDEKSDNDKLANNKTNTAKKADKDKNSNSKPAKKKVGTVTKTLQSKKVKLPEGDKIYFLDVTDKNSEGKYQSSDAIILESNGKYGLIDTTLADGGKLKMASRAIRYLKQLGIKELEFILITHSHGDHTGGLKQICYSGIKVKRLYHKSGSGTFERDSKNAKHAGASIYCVNKHKKNVFKLGNMNFELFNTDYHKGVAENINSIVALVTVNGKRIALTGDSQSYSGNGKYGKKYAEIAAKSIGKVDVLKAAHHGYHMGTSKPVNGICNSEEAIGYYKPEFVVYTNAKNKVSTRSPATFKRMKKFTNAKNWYFAGDGTVIVNVDPNGDITFKQLPANK